MPKTDTTPIHLLVSPPAMDYMAGMQEVFPGANGPLSYMIDRIADGNLERLLEKTEPLVAEFDDVREFVRGSIRFILRIGDVDEDGRAKVLLVAVLLDLAVS